MNTLKKNYGYIIIGLILEIIAIFLLGNSEAKLTFIIALIGIPIGLAVIWYMSKSYENTLISCIFSIFLLPLGGYIFLRLGLLDKQWIFYALFYILVLSLLIKNGLFNRIKKEKVILNNKYIRLVLIFLLIINVFFAYDKQLSFMLVTISFLPFILLFYIIQSSVFEDRKEFYNKILKAAALGALLSAFPDLIYYIISLFRGSNIRLFGPLGANSIIVYTLLMFIIILSKWSKEKGIKNIWTLYILGYVLVLGIQESRGALVAIISTFILYLIFDIKNWKKYISVFFLVGIMMFSNVTARPDVAHDINDVIEETQNNTIKEDSKGAIKDILFKVIDSQSKNRQILWKAGLEITDDYKLTGVGIGNFKLFYKEYSGSERPYSDAHNILLNLSSELGLPFMILSLALMIKFGIDMLVGYFKNKGNTRITYLAGGICLVAFFLYGNLTGIALNFSIEVYSFTSTFIILFMLFYADSINEFS